MHSDPSMDWDDHIKHEDASVEAEIAFWREHRDRILSVTVAIISNANGLTISGQASIGKIVDTAGLIVAEIVNRGEPI